MKITIYSSSKSRTEFIKLSTEFFRSYLNLENSKYELHIFSKKGLRTQDGILGSVSKIDNMLGMFLDNQLSRMRLIQVLAHEMVHVKQFARGQYHSKKTRTGNTLQFWRGKNVKRVYMNRPWEKEAYGREMELIEAFFNHLSKTRKNH